MDMDEKITVELTAEEAEDLCEAARKLNDRTHGRAACKGSALASAWDKLSSALRHQERASA
jgi:predicted DNA-binding transcriptional regulator YafY